MKKLVGSIFIMFSTFFSASPLIAEPTKVAAKSQTLKLYPSKKGAKISVLAPADSDRQGNYLDTGRYNLVEEFTANTLDHREFKLGSEVEYGLTDKFMIGIDTYSMVVGIPSSHIKYRAFTHGNHTVSVGAKAVWLTLENLASFAPAKDHFKSLRAKIVRPTIAWTNSLSSRLKIHTFWTVGLGRVEAELSEKGKREFFEAKHPGGNYDEGTTDVPEVLTPDQTDDETTDAEADSNGETTEPEEPEVPQVVSKKNQEKKSEQSSNISRRTLELQSLFGLSTDRFQITGEFVRSGGKKILVSTRIERMVLEELKANSLSITVAQQWITDHFQFRFGLGVQYLSISGRDLDGEEVDETGTNPIPEVAFYWRF